MSITIHSKYKYFDSTVQRAEDRRQKFHFCRLLFAVNVMLNLSNNEQQTQPTDGTEPASNPGHIAGRRALSPLHQPYSTKNESSYMYN